MELHLCVVSIKVTDMEKAKEFYCEKLELPLVKQYGDSIVELALGSMPVILELVKGRNTLDYHSQAQTVLGLQTDKLERTMEELKQKQVELLFDKPQPCPPGRFTVLSDPFGNKLELLEFAKEKQTLS
ncbi:VOC family protein [Terribacillus saccharophilus]|uniref:VOC family protein n=1 Tax=Terribacillus saccharophilus TaxID=361277 RepID=UPI0039829F0D